MTVVGHTTGGNTVRVDVDADGHPGYLATARMLGEAGMLLVGARHDAGPRGMPDAGDGTRHPVGRPVRARAGALLGQLLTGRSIRSSASIAVGCSKTSPYV